MNPTQIPELTLIESLSVADPNTDTLLAHEPVAQELDKLFITNPASITIVSPTAVFTRRHWLECKHKK
jgi:hypothetical protein